MKKQIPGQMSLFDFIEEPKPADEWALPCDTCGHDVKGCCDYDYINNHDYCVLGDKWIPKPPEHTPPVHRYLRYGPHTLIQKVRDETRDWLDRYGVPDWVKWDKESLPCDNCTWYDGSTCRSGGHTCHYEYGYLICDGFYQSIVERTPRTVGDSFPSIKVCTFSGHTCNKSELWKVADTLDELQCPHVCCRKCNTKACGARCNGSEEPKDTVTMFGEEWHLLSEKPEGITQYDELRILGPYKSVYGERWSNCPAKLCDGEIVAYDVPWDIPKPDWKYWRLKEKVYPLDIKGICDDPYCPQCGYPFETIRS